MLAVLTGSTSIQVPDIVRNVIEKGINEEGNEVIQKMDKFLIVRYFMKLPKVILG